MNKKMNYSNTIIYKICCKDQNISDLYVGHTTNFFTRKQSHRNCCNNQNNSSYNSKLYTYIRENGGWKNWDMIEIAKYNLNNVEEARIKEQEHYEQLQANLNSYPPYIKPNEIKSKQPEDKYDETQKYVCENCKYSTNRKSSFDKHKLSIKHNGLTDIDNEKNSDNKLKCICGNTYSFKQSLCVHRKNCSLYLKCKNSNHLSNNNNNDILKNIIIELIKENTELHNKISSLQKDIESINKSDSL